MNVNWDKAAAAKINAVFDKMIAYATDNLMLDTLDADYTVNRLCSLVGVVPDGKYSEADYGEQTLPDLLNELKALAPDIDVTAVTDLLMPLPHTVNYYFADELGRNIQKAFEFLFELYGKTGEASGADGFVRYTEARKDRSASIPVGGDYLEYFPVSLGNLVAEMTCPDFMSEDVAKRMAAFAEKYGSAIVKRIGDDSGYLSCRSIALENAAVKKTVKDGAVKVALLDYPAPALSVSGPKNSAAREAVRIIKAASDENISCVCACKVGEWTSFYIVFAGDVAVSDTITKSDALTVCGVAATVDFSPLLPVLQKGTALSTDLFAFKSVYTAIGGVKLGDKASSAIDEQIAKQLKGSISAAASVSEDKAVELAQ